MTKRGNVTVKIYTDKNRVNYLQALDTLRSLGRQLNLAVAEYAEAMKLLPPGTSLCEAVADFPRRNSAVRESRTVPQLVAEYIAAKEKASKSEAHLRDIRLRMTRFGESFQKRRLVPLCEAAIA